MPRSSRPMVSFSSARTLCVSSLLFVVALSASLVAADVSSAEEAIPSAPTKVVPTLESLPHTRLPRGVFGGWCGTKDRYLLEVDGQLEAYDAGTKVATIAVSSSWPRQCSGDGQQLVYVDTRMGYVTKVDIASGASRHVASYKVPEFGRAPEISFSSDFQRVMTSKPLVLTADADRLKVILVEDWSRGQATERVSGIRWSGDSSRLFVARGTWIEVFDARGNKIGSGEQKGTFFRDGWFDADQRTLILFLMLSVDEFGPGLLVKCRIADWKCDRLRPRFDSVSLGGRGILGTTGPLGKLSRPTEEIVLYPRYAAEIRDATSSLLARQVYLTAIDRMFFRMSVSPTGTKSVVTWSNEKLAGCGPGDQSHNCKEGIMIDLSKVVR